MRQPLDHQAVCGRLCEFLRSNILAEGMEFREETPLIELDVDSLSLIEMLLFVEREFGIRIPDSHLTRANLHSIATITRCVLELAGQGKTIGLSAPHEDAHSHSINRR
jgi:acyl carrier protein